MVVELQRKNFTLNTFSTFINLTLTQKTRKLNGNILDNSSIIMSINNINRYTNSNMPRNDNNLEALDKTTEKLNANFQVKLHKRKRLP